MSILTLLPKPTNIGCSGSVDSGSPSPKTRRIPSITIESCPSALMVSRAGLRGQQLAQRRQDGINGQGQWPGNFLGWYCKYVNELACIRVGYSRCAFSCRMFAGVFYLATGPRSWTMAQRSCTHVLRLSSNPSPRPSFGRSIDFALRSSNDFTCVLVYKHRP